jgi:hypothetical protein
LKDDRNAIFKKIDNAIFEVKSYRQQADDFKKDIA